jgi:hypothetical protein
MQLHWLSLTGDVSIPSGDDDSAKTGGVARRLAWELGLSQQGEINQVAARTDALFSNNSFKIQKYSCFDDGVRFDFPNEYELAPDSGLVVEAASNDASSVFYNPSILFNALRDEGRGSFEPAQIMGVYEGNLTYPSSIAFESSDLFNSGRNTAYLKELVLKPGQLSVDETTTAKSAFNPSLTKTKWRINPNNDIPWMPQSDLIPVGNIAPFNRGIRDQWDEGPRAYVFPTGTKLAPRQRLTIRITSTIADEGDQTITLGMFSLLEVT